MTIIAMPKPKLSPLPAAAFQILMALANDDLHGHEIMRRVEETVALPAVAQSQAFEVSSRGSSAQVFFAP